MVESSDFLQKLSRLAATGHENRAGNVLQAYGLQAKAKITWVDVGLRGKHPVLQLKDLLACLSKEDKVGEMFLHGHSFADFENFWANYKQHRPSHPVYQEHKRRLSHCIPLFVHTDEGTGQKKKALLICQIQAVLGRGSSRAADLNMQGHSLLTRLLYAVMSSRLYQRRKAPMYKLLQHWADELSTLFKDGVEVTIRRKAHHLFPIVLGAKGDWVDLVKVGRLTRHFMRDSPKHVDPPGVCHLCQAGRRGFPWHLNQAGSAWLLHPPAEDDVPWSTASPLLRIPHDSGPNFFLIDAFHTLHKGVVGDMVASSLATAWALECFVFRVSCLDVRYHRGLF